MGFGSYSVQNRAVRTEVYKSQPMEKTFVQQTKRMIHESMDPKGVTVRECRDSEAHPNSVPVQLFLDVTGSMGMIPNHLVKDGLPHLISTMIEKGVPDVALMFGAIGDHECDSFPLQVGQFESGDEEMDMWLTRTFIESGGGGNGGESYLLAWLFAAYHTATDRYEKRGKKAFVFTVGDEPFLNSLPVSASREIFGEASTAEGTYTAAELHAEACKRNHVFHIFVEHGYRRVDPAWKELMGERCIVIDDYTQVPNVIAGIVTDVLEREDSQGIHIPDSSDQKDEQPATTSPGVML